MAYRVPDRQQHALSLVIAGPILVRLTEVAECDRSINGPDDHPDGDLGGISSHDVAAPDPPFGSDQPGTLERQQDLLQVRLGQARALGDVAH